MRLGGLLELPTPAEGGCKKLSENWYQIRDADPAGVELFERHYSARNRKTDCPAFTGPGEKMVLMTGDANALFVWRLEKYRKDDQTGINCAVFRNESPVRASDLVREAMAIAWSKWPGARLFTFVDERMVKPSSTPGRCFKKAGWDYVKTKDGKRWIRKKTLGGLLILEAIFSEKE